MSEYTNNDNEQLNSLVKYAIRMLEGERGSELYAEYKDVLKKVTPKDVIAIVDELVKTDKDIDDVKRTVNKILNIFYESVKKYGKAQPEEESFLYYLMAENSAMQEKMATLKKEIKSVFSQKDSKGALVEHKESLKSKLLELKDFEKHYLKKENILFPYFEKTLPKHRCVNVMWSMHDDARKSLNKLIQNLERENPSLNEFNFEIGRFYFSVLPVIFRDDYILYPVCLENISKEIQIDMLEQSREIGFSFIKAPEFSDAGSDLGRKEKLKDEVIGTTATGVIDLGTGKMSTNQIVALFNHLPVDITFVDENDEVAYFSNPKDRFFTRSKAIIGRKVQNCHPPESIDVVNKIIESFRSGRKDKESFWIQMKGKFILIQYFAVRDKKGNYTGVIEVSQDITDIKKLEGERRLLD